MYTPKLMLFSRRVYSPQFLLPGNKIDRTPGFYGYLPKFWNCKKHNFDSTFNPYTADHKADEWLLDFRHTQKKKHSNCKFPHLSWPGNIVYVFPRRGRVIFYYFGHSPNSNDGRLVWQPDYSRKYKGIEIK